MGEVFRIEDGAEIQYLVVLVTTKDKEEALSIAEVLVSEKLCACVNIVDSVVSVFTWNGKIERSTEGLMIIKTQVEAFSDLLERVKELHSYDVPEIIALPIIAGNPSYLKWIEELVGDYHLE